MLLGRNVRELVTKVLLDTAICIVEWSEIDTKSEILELIESLLNQGLWSAAYKET